MPKKPSLTVQMSTYPQHSIGRYIEATLDDIEADGGDMLKLWLVPDAGPKHAGQRLAHELPMTMADGSPLCHFLKDAFGISLSMGQSFDLGSLIGRRVMIRFGKPGPDGAQPIEAFKVAEPHRATTRPMPTLGRTEV